MTFNKQKGFVAVVSVLMLSAILFSMSITITSRAISKTSSELSFSASQQAKLLAHSCAEYALLELQRTLDYVGGETRTIGEYTCDILNISGSGNTDRIVQSKAAVDSHVHRMEIEISAVSPEMTITSWESVTQF